MSSRLVRNTIYGTLAGCSATLSNFICGLIIARQLGAQLMGDVVFLTWIASTASVVVTFGIPFTMSKFLLEVEVQRGAARALSLATYIAPRFLLAAFIPLVLGILIVTGAPGVGAYLHTMSPSLGAPEILLLLGSLCVLLSLAEFARAVSRGMQRFDRLAKVTILSAVVQSVAAFLLVRGHGAVGALLSYAVGAAVVLALLRPLIGVTPESDTTGRRCFRRYAVYRWGSEMLALFIWCRIEVIFLQYYCGSTSVALFTVAMTLANLAIQAPLMLTWGLMPHFVERFALADHEGMQTSFATATRFLAALVLPACFGTAAIAHALLPLLFGAAFAPADHVAEILIAAAAFPCIASVGSSVLLASDRSDVDFYACLAGSIVSVALGILLTKSFGLIGAAVSRSVVQFGVALVGTLFLCTRFRLVLPLPALVRLVWCATLCAVVAGTITRTFPGSAAVVIAIIAGVVTYAASVWFFSVIERRDIELFKRLVGSVIRSLPRPWLRGGFRDDGLSHET